MSQKRILIILAIIAGVIVLCACAAVGGYYLMNTPLAPALSVSTESFTPFPQILPQATADAQSAPLPAATTMPAGPVTNCGQSGTMNILVMGVDAPSELGIKGPLAIRIVRIDFSRKTAGVFAFPRDLWLPIAGLESYGITQARLGESYLIARSNAGMSTAAATNLVAQNLYKNFGVLSDHYLTGKLTTLAAMIDSVGGILVNIPVAYDGTPWHGHYFPAGPYSMTGSLALEYSMSRSVPGQWSAMDRQSQVLLALFQKIFSPETLTKIPSLIPQFLQAMTTDLTLQQAMDLICIFQEIPKEKITISGVGPNDVTYGASGVLYPNFDVIRAKVQQFLNPV